MTAFPRLRRLGAPIASAIVTAAVFTGALWVQHAREAWPFATQPSDSGSADDVRDAIGRGHRLYA
jgi:hypothetical protein